MHLVTPKKLKNTSIQLAIFMKGMFFIFGGCFISLISLIKANGLQAFNRDYEALSDNIIIHD